ncbi:sensor histidine kinase [Pseudalkalibacillus caeni]|uniref:Signal transduction histidine-protein kinase/phosphatase DegS n=1 Tax=Exobacillus caeni TaxID=2574798 RepID=A0A5R9FD64_9BACL|nr:sensor histidine kinase [Pseudalkalibacillus caeni]TLS38504.1 histidine kinase [Pseudalkalibacillus caeni]
MASNKIDPAVLDAILNKTIETVNQSKNKIFDIGEHSQHEFQELSKELLLIKEELQNVIKSLERLKKEDRFARAKLVKVSKHFHEYGEQEIRDAYEKASHIQVKLSVEQQRLVQLQDKKNDIERRLEYFRVTNQKAGSFIGQISTVLSYLNGELRQVGAAIQDAQRRQEFGLQIIEAQEEERRRVSREIHDGPAQMLANVLVRSQLIERIFEKKGKEAAFKEIKEMRVLIEEALQEVRRLIYDLRPMALDDLGLIPTLKKYLNRINNESRTEIYFDHGDGQQRLPVRLEIAIFRLVQEAVQNSLKHADATEIEVDLEIEKQNIHLKVKDNGIGFNTNERKENSFGIIGMKERVELLNGKIEIQSTPNKGTYILIDIPIHEQEGTT